MQPQLLEWRTGGGERVQLLMLKWQGRGCQAISLTVQRCDTHPVMHAFCPT